MSELSGGDIGTEAPTHFEKNFQPKEMNMFGGSIDVVDIPPERPTDKLPILFAPGFAETLKINKPPIHVLADDSKRRVLSLTHMREGGELEPAYERVVEQIKARLTAKSIPESEIGNKLRQLDIRKQDIEQNYSPAILRRALTIISFLEEKVIDKVAAIGHSLGGIDLVVAAYLFPDLFDNLVLNGSGGIIGEDKTKNLVGRTSRQMGHDMLQKPFPHGSDDETLLSDINQMKADRPEKKDDIENLRRNIPRAVEETRAIADTRIERLISIVRKEGIGVAFVHGVKDRIFPNKKVQNKGLLSGTPEDKFSAEGELEGVAVDGYVSIQGSHNAQYVEPRVMKLANWLLTKLEDKKQNKQQGEVPSTT